MTFLLASLAWIVIGILLGIGIWLAAVKGSFILLGIVIIGLVVAVGKIGCASH
jgi:hypothetical protein